ncbi:MAG TPA: hypothetical protein VF466_01480 [Candidatus Saccharimonadales bacterium]
MPVPEALTPIDAQQQIAAGSDIVVVPYSSYMEQDGSVRLSIFSEMTTLAAAALHREAGAHQTRIIAVGEQTYGVDHPSTTDLMYDLLQRERIPDRALPEQRPNGANATPQQIEWLKRKFSGAWADRPPVLVGHEHHWDRIHRLCDVFSLPADFVDASAVLERAGKLKPEFAAAVAAYQTEGRAYEQGAAVLTRIVAPLGEGATLGLFRTMVRARTPTVVDVFQSADGRTHLYATTVREHLQAIGRAA